MLAKALPIEGDEFSERVEINIKAFRALPKEAQIALKCAYVFGSKAPIEEREDLFQDIALTMLKANVNEPKLAYSIARIDWCHWWSKQYAHKVKFCVYYSKAGKESPNCEHCEHKAGSPCAWLAVRPIMGSLESVTEDNEGSTITLAETIVGEVEFEAKMCDKIQTETIWARLPANVKPLVVKRLIGESLTHSERNTLNYFVRAHGASLILA